MEVGFESRREQRREMEEHYWGRGQGSRNEDKGVIGREGCGREGRDTGRERGRKQAGKEGRA